MTQNKGATVHPIDDRIFIRRQKSSTTTIGGLHKPEGAEESCLRGVIAAVGPGMPTMTGDRMPITVRNASGELVPVEVGDGVIYTSDAGSAISIESGEFDVLHFRDAICVLKQDVA